MADLIDRQTIIEAIHSAIYPYFCGAEDGDTLSEDEKLVLSVNKAVCTAIKALPSAQPVGNMISRQAATEVADAVWAVTGDTNVAKVWDQLKDLPSVEAVEVVRCKNCRLSEPGIGIVEYWCCYWDNKTLENGYCSYGERKDGEQNETD